MAHHCAEAGLNEKAVGYWLKAGQQAVARSAMTEAVVAVAEGIGAYWPPCPTSPRAMQHELDLKFALGQALMATRGYSAPEVAETFARARVLAERLDRPDFSLRCSIANGSSIWFGPSTSWRCPLPSRWRRLGETRKDQTTLLLGHYIHGASCYFRGEFADSARPARAVSWPERSGARAICAAIAVADPHAATPWSLGVDIGASGPPRSGTRTRGRGVVGSSPARPSVHGGLCAEQGVCGRGGCRLAA